MESVANIIMFSEGSWVYEDTSNPEMCDMGGWPTYEVYYIEGSTKYGNVFKSKWSTRNREEAQAMLDRLEEAFNNGRKLDSDKWDLSRRSYGSKAYQDNWEEEEFRSMDEEEREARGY